MSVDNDKVSSGRTIEATEFQAPAAAADRSDSSAADAGLKRGLLAARHDAPWWHSQFNLMLFVFGLLGLATLVFVILTPAPEGVGQPSTLISAEGEISSGTSSVSASATIQSAPFDESQREQARTDSQDILSELLAVKKELEQKQVSEWADAAFSAAIAMATDGDAYYQQQDYANAIQLYKKALAAMDDVRALIPTELGKRVAAGLAAVAQGKSDLARQRFEAALLLDRNHIPALQGLDRVKTLDQVLALSANAALYEQDFASSDALADIQLAIEKYQQAIDLDSQALAAKAGLVRSQQLENDKRYRMAMSNGFNALFAKRYSNARAGFNQALQLKPDDVTASSALRQALASDKRTSLRSLLGSAKQFEAREQWASALSNYQTVLQRDPNQVSAKIGRIRTQARLDLDKSIKSILNDRLSLSRSSTKEEALKVLEDARGIRQPGSILKQQILDLSASLKQIEQPIKVAFSSDSLTQVSLKKAGAKRLDLGKFNEKKLALTPGRYTLLGTRLGFHDVRTEIELNPGVNGIQTFTVTCTELVAAAG